MRTLLLALVLVAACNKADPAQTAPQNAAAAAAGTTTSPAVAAASSARHAAAIDQAPADATVVASLDLSWLVDGLVSGGLLPTTRDPAAFRKALGEASRKDFGIDILAIRSLSVWAVVERKAFAVVAEGPFDGQLAVAGAPDGEVGGVKSISLDNDLHLALVDGRLVLGNGPAFQLLAAPSAGPGNREKHKAVLGAVTANVVQVTTVVPAELAGQLPVGGLESAALSLSSTFELSVGVIGSAASLDQLAAMVDTARNTLLSSVTEAVTSLKSMSFPGSSVVQVMAEAGAEDLRVFKFTERPSPTLLTGHLPGLNLGSAAIMVVPAMGAVAIPAFLGYQARALESSQVIEHKAASEAIRAADPAEPAAPMVVPAEP